MQPPDGPPVWTALNARPSGAPPPISNTISRSVIPIGTSLLTIKEKSRWAMGSMAVGAFGVAVMAVRLQQIWNTYA